jgi:hypothetical protein
MVIKNNYIRVLETSSSPNWLANPVQTQKTGRLAACLSIKGIIRLVDRYSCARTSSVYDAKM